MKTKKNINKCPVFANETTISSGGSFLPYQGKLSPLLRFRVISTILKKERKKNFFPSVEDATLQLRLRLQPHLLLSLSVGPASSGSDTILLLKKPNYSQPVITCHFFTILTSRLNFLHDGIPRRRTFMTPVYQEYLQDSSLFFSL